MCVLYVASVGGGASIVPLSAAALHVEKQSVGTIEMTGRPLPVNTADIGPT